MFTQERKKKGQKQEDEEKRYAHVRLSCFNTFGTETRTATGTIISIGGNTTCVITTLTKPSRAVSTRSTGHTNGTFFAAAATTIWCCLITIFHIVEAADTFISLAHVGGAIPVGFARSRVVAAAASHGGGRRKTGLHVAKC